ncbi:MAG: PAS domain S-box protein [Candidatus Lokiarchaeota archaeon]|nr:PAS domain S-box protein [Candidatus Lokiarchaeota archaeon]MBD3200244.1 PAS domain S-box protein [Candidatus Lokiarchaeota archaeon]
MTQFNEMLTKSEIERIQKYIETKINSKEDLFTFIEEFIKNKLEDKRSESEEKYKHLFENAPLTIILFNSEGILVDVNKEANSLMSRHNFQDLLGLHYKEIWSFNEKNKQLIGIYDTFFDKLLKNHNPVDIEFPIYQSLGGLKWVHAYTSTFSIENKKYIQFLLRDITNLKESEAKLKESSEIIESIRQQSFISIVIIQDNLFKYFNDKYLNVVGYSREEVENWEPGEFLKIIYPDDREFVKTQALKKQKGNNDVIENYQFRGIKKSGKIFWAEIFSKSIIYNGRPADFVLFLDITERKQFEKQLMKSELKFRTIAEQTSIGIAIFKDRKIEYLNEAYARILGYPFHEVKDWTYKNLGKLIPTKDLIKIKKNIHLPNFQYNDTIRYVKKFETGMQTTKWLETTLKVIEYEKENAILLTLIDLTEKKEAELELKKLNALKSEFIKRISHELKTPLVSIMGFSNLLIDLYNKKLDEDVISIINEIKKGSKRLQHLIEDILKASELESEEIKFKKIKQNLITLIKYVLEELRGALESRKHIVKLDLHEKLIAKYHPNQMREVIENLIINAIKYTPTGGEISIRSEKKNNFIKISIQDTGIGLTEQEQKSIFKEFGKIEKYGQGYDIETEGSGLGLFISKKIVEHHGGEIGVLSKGKNEGSTFYFTLPKTIEK